MFCIKNYSTRLYIGLWFLCFFLFPSLCIGHPHVFIDFTATLIIKDDALHGMDIVWTFDRFTSEMMIDDIDKNQNQKIEPDEMEFFNKHYRSIDEDANFFIQLYLGKDTFVDFDASLERVHIENQKMVYDIKILFTNPLRPSGRKSLLIEFYDPEMFVAYSFQEGNSNESHNQGDANIRINPLPKREACFSVEFYPAQNVSSSEVSSATEAVQASSVVEDVTQPVRQNQGEDTASIARPGESLFKSLRDKLFSIQGMYNRKLGELVIDAKDNFSLKIGLSLIVLSFLYGILHALGPGHGKSVVVGYFLQWKASSLQVVFTGIMISIIHTGSAILIALLFQSLLSSYVGFERIRIQSNFSFIIACFIFFVGIGLLIQIIRNHRCGSTHDLDTNQSAPKWIYAAGLIPCPLSITILLVSVTQNILWLGLISVISISLGMMVVLIVAGLLAMAAKTTTYTYSSSRWGIASKLHDVLEYCGASLIISFGLGLMLLYMPKF